MRRAFLTVVCLTVIASPALAQDEPTANSPFDFAISRTWLTELRAQKTFLPTFKVTMTHRSNVKDPPEDCEMHLAGTLNGTDFGDPSPAVVEPPNLCKFKPGAKTPVTGTTSTKALWRTKMDNDVLNEDCDVTGFPRVYTEHANGGGTGPSNPRHVFEIHPATRIKCGSTDLNFVPFFRSFPNLRHIAPDSAHTCLTQLRMWVRYHNEDNEDQYEFFQKRPAKCGNFAIVEVFSVPKEWIQPTGGGHTAIARITANGADTVTLKLYAVEGTPVNDWLARLKKGQELMDDPRLIHGILTYDYFSMVRTIGEKNGELAKPADWTEIPFPLAFVILGPTSVIPWDDQ